MNEVTDYGLDYWDSIPGWYRGVSTGHHFQTVYFTGLKRADIEADHSPPSNAKVKELLDTNVNALYSIRLNCRIVVLVEISSTFYL